MNICFRFCRWCRGLGHGRGFGIQSPFAYDLVRNVINQRSPYYQYDDLAKEILSLNGRNLKTCRLLFRLSNYLRPSKVYVAEGLSDYIYRYVFAGCHAASLTKDVTDCDVCVVKAAQDVVDVRFRELKQSAVLVLLDIYADADSLAVWQNIIARDECRVSFDLYSLGIVFLQRKYQKNDYVINF